MKYTVIDEISNVLALSTVNHASKSPLARSFKASVTQEKGQRHGAKGHIKTLTQ